MTGYFSLCTLCCMRAIPIFACPALPFGPFAAAEITPVEARLRSELLFHAGRFGEVFEHYRGQALAAMCEPQLLAVRVRLS